MTPDEFDAAFDEFRISVFRLETLQQYAVSAEDARLRAFRAGLPRPELAGACPADRRALGAPSSTLWLSVWPVDSSAVELGDDRVSRNSKIPGTGRNLGPDFWYSTLASQVSLRS